MQFWRHKIGYEYRDVHKMEKENKMSDDDKFHMADLSNSSGMLKAQFYYSFAR